MKRLIERIICIALVVSFVLPNVAIPKVKAANVFSPIGTVTILVEKDPFPSGAFSSDVPEIEEQLEKEAVSDIPTNASKWTKLRYYDHLPWGEIHKRVQDDIWMTNSSPMQVGELYVPYVFAKGYEQDTINEWGSDHSTVLLTDINSDEITVSDQWGSNLLISVNDTDDVLTISNFKWGQATYTFKFADGAEGYVDKDTWQLVLTKEPDVVDEEIDQEVDNEELNSDENTSEEASQVEGTDSTDESTSAETPTTETDINTETDDSETNLVA